MALDFSTLAPVLPLFTHALQVQEWQPLVGMSKGLGAAVRIVSQQTRATLPGLPQCHPRRCLTALPPCLLASACVV